LTIRRQFRAYLDTPVFGGVYDEGFAAASRSVFDHVRRGRLVVMVGSTVLAELSEAPERVRQVLADLDPSGVVVCPITVAVEELRDAYIEAGVLGEGSLDDATHVATATVHDADMIVNWNFKHIVNFQRMRVSTR
jgi:hypothetical protein